VGQSPTPHVQAAVSTQVHLFDLFFLQKSPEPVVRKMASEEEPPPHQNGSDGSSEQIADNSYVMHEQPSNKSMNGAEDYLLPEKCIPAKVTLILDLDETLVHSSFKPVANADFVVPVEVDGIVHRVFVCKRPGVDAFMKRVSSVAVSTSRSVHEPCLAAC
jgi:hypothetical protein